MKEDYTHIAVILDRSGSMSSMVSDVVGGFDNFIKEQKKEEGEATFSLVQFDDVYEIVHDFINIKDVTGLKLSPRGSTALLDAMGQTLEEVRAKVLAMSDDKRPSKVIFVFITDGDENASGKYTRKQIFEMIKDLKSPDRSDQVNWEFVFIGANQDAISEGSGYGIGARSAMTFDSSGSGGATAAFCSLSRGISTYRACKADMASYTFDDSDYKEQEKFLKKDTTTSTGNTNNLTRGIAKIINTGKSKRIIPSNIPDLDDGIINVNENDETKAV